MTGHHPRHMPIYPARKLKINVEISITKHR
jgi:hypothetical protein